MNITPYISMDACAGNVTDVCKIGQELSEISRNGFLHVFSIHGCVPTSNGAKQARIQNVLEGGA